MRLFTNKRGSAIIMALVTITILLVLGMAVITLSMGTLTTNVADATTNDTYYAAEAGINSAIEQVKAEVVKYYAEMSKLLLHRKNLANIKLHKQWLRLQRNL